jgi:hypothetical protein
MAIDTRRIWPNLNYVKKQCNVVADALSCLGMLAESMNDETSDGEAAELYAVTAEEEYRFPKDFPLSYAKIQYRQEHDATL